MATDLSGLPPELRSPWEKPPAKDARIEWVFLHADVIGHSRLFKDHMGSAALLRNHEALGAFRKAVETTIPHFHEDMEWDWAGDGGIFAFPDTVPDLETAKRVILTAELIRDKIRQDNELKDPALRFEVRLVITRGWALYYDDKAVRCGSALNVAAKLRVAGERTSIIVTKSVVDELRDHALRELFRPVEPVESFGEAVYVYLPALRDALQASLDEEAESGDKMQAAHLAYRLGVLEFGTGDRDDAARAFQRALNLLGAVQNRHRYYHRTLTAFYMLWSELVSATPSRYLAHGDRNDRRQFLRQLANDPDLRKRFGSRWQFLHEMEFCIEQLDLLARQPIVGPSGLTTMQMCLLLERFGYPRHWHGSAIEKRIERIVEEIKPQRGQQFDQGTMDKGCTLCTAVAASCLTLDADGHDARHNPHDERPDAGPLITWLISKRPARYSFRNRCCESRVEENEHALHYAASVMQAVVDYNSPSETIRDVVDVFFTHGAMDDHLPADWVRFLHIPYFDFAYYVFSAFARTICAWATPADIGITPVRHHRLRNALTAFGNRLLSEAAIAKPCRPERLYAARENLGSFALGLLVGFPEDSDIRLMFVGVRNLIALVASTDKLDEPERRKTTIDSNFDRTWRMLDGWLLQWECALTARERSIEIPPELVHLFPILF